MPKPIDEHDAPERDEDHRDPPAHEDGPDLCDDCLDGRPHDHLRG